MTQTQEREFEYARAMRSRGTALPADGLPGETVLDSWLRCIGAGQDHAATPEIVVIETAELERRRERAAVTRRLARAELETLAQQIAGSNFLLAFADSDGFVLDVCSDNRFSMSGSGAGIVEGSCWAESLCGTNGMGTALATGQSVAVTGLEHYFLHFGGISCTASPVRDAQGEIVGILDASSYFESRQRHTQALVRMAAATIENGLLMHQTQSRCVLAVHPRPEFLRTLSAGLLAFDDTGCLVALNARSRQLLPGLEGLPGHSFETLFNAPYDQVLAQLWRGGDLRLRDSLGSSLVVTCVRRPVSARRPVHSLSGAVGTVRSSRRREVPHPPAPSPPPQVLGADPAVLDAIRLVESAVRMSVPILIHGETGTGKEVLARHAHAISGRPGAFVAINCGALPHELFEAELFGYVGGAFTGARREGSPGLIVRADRGTLLLDEVRELPLPLQAALLRFLDDQVVRAVGGTVEQRVDVQLLAATHADLEEEVAARRFRADLMYRLNTVRVELPPLHRRSDFAAAVRSTLASLDPGATITDDAVERLGWHAWPGNFRELRSVLTRGLLATTSRAASASAAHDTLARHREDSPRQLSCADMEALLPATLRPAASALQRGAGDMVRREFERTGRSVSQTSRNLGISRTTVYRHLRES